MKKKNMILKRTVTGLAASLLAVSMIFTGCGKSNSNSSSNNNVNNTTGGAVTSENVTTARPEPETSPRIELEGEEVPAQLANTLNVIDDKNRNYYEIFVGSFYDSNGDGMGDLQGVIQKLDYINDGDPNTDTDLGCNGIWLMPINPSPSYHKYDVKDYKAIDEQYGTMDDFKQLIEECNKRGITVIIDLVMNHSALGNQWFRDAVTYLKDLPDDKEPNTAECKYVGYYTFVKGQAVGNYYQAGSSAYYYEGMFSQQMPDLNLDNPDVRAEFEEIAKFWLDLGVGGFRLDAAKEYFSGQTDKNVEVLTWFNNYVKSVNPNAYIVAETWTPEFARYLDSGIDSAFDFSYSGIDGNLTFTARNSDPTYDGLYFANCLLRTQENVLSHSTTAVQAPFLSNHDINRPAAFLAYGEEKIKFAHGLLSIMNGSPFIYYGDEIGLGGSGADENKRSPMIWSGTDPTGQCTGPVNMKKDEVINKFASVEEQLQDPYSILNYVKHAMKLRNMFPEIARGTVALVEEVTDTDICAISKTYNGSKIIILANTNKAETKCVPLSRANNGYTCIQGILTVGADQPYQVEDTIVLPPNAIVILK
ncbi:MAG: alpha amylase [Lachnospiraceae bacterium]|nr:alpha amylase [Lachnospiraceae bacterium]